VTSYPNSSPHTLSDSHLRELKDSDIAPEVIAARGYRTIRHRSQVPDEFADWQRRLGLLVPTYSPDGQTKGHQLKPNKLIRRKDGSAPKYETAAGSTITLDVNPLMLEEVRGGDGDLWVTEGPKKVDALTSRGEPTVGIIGVWNFAEPGSKSRTPLSCWNHVRLRGRRVIIVYDADAKTNPDVQEALRRLVAMLEGLGAEVLVVYLPAVNGDGKAGVDDYLAGGGTVAELRLMAGFYEPVDVGAERLREDDKLRAGVEDLERRFWAEAWTGMGGASARDVYLKLIEATRRSGKVVEGGIRVVKAQGPLALEAKVSTRTLWKALGRLEEWGFIYRDNEGRKPDKSGAFVLRANVSHKGRTRGGEGNVTPQSQTYDPVDLHLRAPRLRWSQPRYTPRRGLVTDTRKVRQSPKPESRPTIKRLGKVRGSMIDALNASGGSLALEQMAEILHRKRPRDIRRRHLPMLEEAGIITVEGDTVSLTQNWLEALEEQREIGKEIEAEELARRRCLDKSRAFHRRHKAPVSNPSAASLEAIRRSRESKAAGLAAIVERAAAAAKTEEQRKAEAFVRDRLRELGRIRLALLQDIWHDAGGDPWTIPKAVEGLGCRVEELPEYDNRRFVFAPSETEGAA
jgi:Domain of unknown function (DUF3854)